VLSPFRALAFLYVNGITHVSNKSTLFADDTVVSFLAKLVVDLKKVDQELSSLNI